MPGKEKESSSSSSTNNSLDETNALINEKIDDFSKIEERFDATER